MNGYGKGKHVAIRKLAPVVLAAALAVPLGAAAVNVGDAVTTRPEAVQQHNGRDSVFGLTSDPVYRPAQPTVERYGRAGGYVGTDRVQMMDSAAMSDSGARIVEPQSAKAPQPSDSGAADSGRTSERRFDNPDSAHGQQEGSMRTQ